ncbi:MAG: general secretion pathway protein GspK [Rhodobacteraceae bacterium]|nr:general secretion pathway protein GspK [Paracoccaceae bacterium]
MRIALTRRRAARGYVLITVLWVGLALLLSVAAFLASSRTEALAVRAEVNATRAVELARSGLNVALADLGRIDPDQPITPRDGTEVTLQMAEGTVTYSIQDEAGKIDVLAAPPELLTPALASIGENAGIDAFDAATIAQALEGFLRTPEGGTASVYDALTAAGLPRASALVASRYLTTLNFTAQVNPATAPRLVLAAIPGLGPSDVEDILLRRSTGQGMPRLGSAAAWLVELASPVYTIETEATLTTGGTARLVAQVAQRGLAFRGGLMRYDILSVRIVR